MPGKLPEGSVLGRINALLNEINREKRAGVRRFKSAATDDPGGAAGETENPVKDVDNNAEEVEPGSRAAEHEEDIAAAYPGVGVDEVDPESGGDQADKQIQSELTQSLTGEDPETEDNYKGEIEDPGTESPVNVEEIGRKYGSVSYPVLAKAAYSRMYDVLCSIASGEPTEKSAAHADSDEEFSFDDWLQAAAVGYQMADEILKKEASNLEADDAAAVNLLHKAVEDASVDADLVGQWLGNYLNERAKFANVDANPDAMAAMMAMANGGEPPPSEPVPVDPSVPMPEEAEAPVDQGLGGTEPSGQEASQEEYERAVNDLVNALAEAGIPPEELVEAAQAQAESAEGAAEAIPPEDTKVAAYRPYYWQQARQMRQLAKLARAARRHIRNGKFRFKEAAPGTQARADRDEIISYIREVCRR
ncbi:MAG: hypothetical protein ONA69_06630 [candidate division KSB1 bacterium]|nr:hypothetical protein [candidate division KSB1 bacterium]